MNYYTTNYKTSTESGNVQIAGNKGKYVASFDGSENVKVKLTIKSGVSCLIVNLKDLNEVNALNAPNKNLVVAIALPNNNHRKMIKELTKSNDVVAGKYCGDGIYRSYESIREMNYTQQVLAGEYKE